MFEFFRPYFMNASEVSCKYSNWTTNEFQDYPKSPKTGAHQIHKESNNLKPRLFLFRIFAIGGGTSKVKRICAITLYWASFYHKSCHKQKQSRTQQPQKQHCLFPFLLTRCRSENCSQSVERLLLNLTAVPSIVAQRCIINLFQRLCFVWCWAHRFEPAKNGVN